MIIIIQFCPLSLVSFSQVPFNSLPNEKNIIQVQNESIWQRHNKQGSNIEICK